MPTTESGDSPTPALKRLTYLLSSSDTEESRLVATERVFESLRVRLSTIMGASGYATLLARSITLTRREHPSLSAVSPDAYGSLIGRVGAITEQNAIAVTDAFVAVLARFDALLQLFIGTGLSEQLLMTVWQDLQDNEPNGNDGVDL